MGRPKKVLTEKDVEEAERECHTRIEQAKYLGISPDVYRRERRRLEGGGGDVVMTCITERDPKLELRKDLEMTSFKNDCDDIYKRSAKTIGYNEVTIDLGDDDVGVKIDCDWHIGNEMTYLPLWARDIETTVKTPRLFTVLAGDYTDNLDAIKKAGTYESIMSVPEAKQKVRNAVTKMGSKILGVVQGCHDEWFFNQDSWDISQYLADHSEGYWLGFRGIINIILGEQKYRIHVRHKYRRHSTDNLSWGMLYSYRRLPKAVDIMMSGHHHHPIVHSNWERGQKVHFIMGGSYKPFDRFIEQRDIDEGTPLMPSVLLRSDKHEITPFLDFNDMVDFL